MKLEISVKFIDENGMEATKPVTVDTSVPDFDDFHERGGFTSAPSPIYNVPIDVDMNFDPNPILWTLENTLIPIRGHQTVPLL